MNKEAKKQIQGMNELFSVVMVHDKQWFITHCCYLRMTILSCVVLLGFIFLKLDAEPLMVFLHCQSFDRATLLFVHTA